MSRLIRVKLGLSVGFAALATLLAGSAFAQSQSPSTLSDACEALKKSSLRGLERHAWSFPSAPQETLIHVTFPRVETTAPSGPNAGQIRARLQAKFAVMKSTSTCIGRFDNEARRTPLRLSFEVVPAGRLKHLQTAQDGERAKLAKCLVREIHRLPSSKARYTVSLEAQFLEVPCGFTPTPNVDPDDADVPVEVAPQVEQKLENFEQDYIRDFGTWSRRWLAFGPNAPFNLALSVGADTSEKISILSIWLRDADEGLECREMRLYVDGVEVPHADNTQIWRTRRGSIRAFFLASAASIADAPKRASIKACGVHVELDVDELGKVLKTMQAVEDGRVEPNLTR